MESNMKCSETLGQWMIFHLLMMGLAWGQSHRSLTNGATTQRAFYPLDETQVYGTTPRQSLHLDSAGHITAAQMDIAAFGGLCDGVHDDGPAISAASAAAGAVYAASGSTTEILITHGKTGKCLVNTGVTYQSGSHFTGSGGTITVTARGVTAFSSGGAVSGAAVGDVSNVEFDQVVINQTTSGSAQVIYYLGGTGTGAGKVTPQSHFYVKNSIIHGGGYAIVVNVYSQGDGKNHHLTDVQITGNRVSSDLISSNYDTAARDGIHLGGDLSDFHVDHNTVTGRDDACIGFSSTGGSSAAGFPGILSRLTPTHGTASSNICNNDAVGLDFSGGSDIVAAGNKVSSRIATTSSAPALRFIFDYYPTPNSIKVIGGSFSNDAIGADPSVFKLDFAGTAVAGAYPVCNCSITAAEFGGLGKNPFGYFLGRDFTMTNNIFDRTFTGLTFEAENGNYSDSIVISGSKWMGRNRKLVYSPIQYSLRNSLFVNDQFNGAILSFPIVPTHLPYRARAACPISCPSRR